jgi:hypothetical protein
MMATVTREVLVRHAPGIEDHPDFTKWTDCVRDALRASLGGDLEVSFRPAQPHQHERVFLGMGFESDDGSGRRAAEAALAAVQPCGEPDARAA